MPPSIAISQLREIYIDAELELIDTANWFPRVMRKDYKLGVEVSHRRPRRARPEILRELCLRRRAQLTGYCDPETDKLIDAQSMEANPEKRRKLVWQIERRLAEDASRPVLLYSRFANLHAAARQGAGDDDQQPLQRLAHGRRLARPITSTGAQ